MLFTVYDRVRAVFYSSYLWYQKHYSFMLPLNEEVIFLVKLPKKIYDFVNKIEALCPIKKYL